MKLRALAFLCALVMAVFASTTALAVAPPGTVTVTANGCTFTVLIDLEQAYDIVGWKVKQYNAANWNEGLTLFKGSSPTDPTGGMTVGPFTAPEGHYNVAVDNEYPPDGSSIVVDFWLTCPTGAPAPSSAPVESSAPAESSAPVESSAPAESSGPAESSAPAASSSPAGVEQPVAGSPSPNGAVEGVTGTPVNNVSDVTPPPTDSIRTVRSGSNDGWRFIVLGLAALIAAAVTLDATRTSARAKRSRRR
jgi:hypothetical protein